MNRYRNKLVYDSNNGEIRDDKRHMSILEDFYMPRREGGRGTEISTLDGGQNLGEIEDVDYFKKNCIDHLTFLSLVLKQRTDSTWVGQQRSPEMS